MVIYKARGLVLGNLWGGGQGGYAARELSADSLPKLDKQIKDGIKDGSLDSGMGFESLVGAVMMIETIDTRRIDGKTFIASKYEQEVYGSLSDEQIDMLTEAIYC